VCGRFALFSPAAAIADYFDCALPIDAPALEPHYNLTPGQPIAAVRAADGERVLAPLRWGLVPYWAKDPSIGRRLVNARAEGIAAKPAFRDAFRRRRCLIPADGFYEWAAAPKGSRRQPYFVTAVDEPLLALAGVWERWRDADGHWLETVVIVTVAANDVLAPIHDRMPLLVRRADQAAWLSSGDPPAVEALARNAPRLGAHAVGIAVNDPRTDDASLIAPLEP
jgi:putative SOS response-associated peptidase YedK